VIAPSDAPTPGDERARIQAFWQVFREAQENMRGAQDWSKAADGFRRALELDPSHQDSMYYLGSSLYELGDYEGALEQFELLAETEPMSLRANLQIGTLRSMPASGAALDLEAAATALERAVAINPEESGALTRLGGVQLALGEVDDAETSLRQARTLNFRSHEAFYLGGYVAWQRGQMDDAVALLKKSVEIVQPQEGAAQPMSEGDTKRADRSALVSAAHAERQLFGALLTDLAAVKPEAVDEAFATDEYARLATYLEALAAPEARAGG
jgi:tetratricopeptide (TPR) repeat protein